MRTRLVEFDRAKIACWARTRVCNIIIYTQYS